MKKDTQEILKDISKDLELRPIGINAMIIDRQEQKKVVEFNKNDLLHDIAEMPDGKYLYRLYGEKCKREFLEDKIPSEVKVFDRSVMKELLDMLRLKDMKDWLNVLSKKADESHELSITSKNGEEKRRYGYMELICEAIADRVRDVVEFFNGKHPSKMTPEQVKELENEKSVHINKRPEQNRDKINKSLGKNVGMYMEAQPTVKKILGGQTPPGQKPSMSEVIARVTGEPIVQNSAATLHDVIENVTGAIKARTGNKPMSLEESVNNTLAEYAKTTNMPIITKVRVPEEIDYQKYANAFRILMRNKEVDWMNNSKENGNIEARAVKCNRKGELEYYHENIEEIHNLREIITIDNIEGKGIQRGDIVPVNGIDCVCIGDNNFIIKKTLGLSNYDGIEKFVNDFNKENGFTLYNTNITIGETKTRWDLDQPEKYLPFKDRSNVVDELKIPEGMEQDDEWWLKY